MRSTGSAALFKGGDILVIRLCERCVLRVWAREVVVKDSVSVQAEGALGALGREPAGGVDPKLPFKDEGLRALARQAKTRRIPDNFTEFAPATRAE